MDFYKLNDFYPHHGPSKYAYTSSFGLENNRGKTAEMAAANTDYSLLATQSGNKYKILFNLKILIDGARKAELAFLSSTGINIMSENVIKEIFENFNLILNSQKLFERNLDILRTISEGANTKLIDPSKFFHTYLNQAIKKYAIGFNLNKATGKQLEKLLDRIMGEALENTYKKCKEVIDKKGNRRILEGSYDKKKYNEKYTHDMDEMIQMIHSLRNTGIFGKYSNLFNVEDELRKSAGNSGIVGTLQMPHFTTSSTDQGGTPLEIITSVVAAEFAKVHLINTSPGGTVTISAEQTGSKAYNQQKGDSMIAYAQGSVDLSKMQPYFAKQTDSSDRVKNIKALQEYLSTIGQQIEHLLVISDKNSIIKAEYDGAKAQDEMKLIHARTMLELFGVPGVEGLIDYLANCGPDMIQGADANAQVRTALASYIAYFLFDHVEVTGNINIHTNVVNIINLSGTYIPLSVYLEGVYRGLEKRLNNHRADYSLVSVSLHFGGNAPASKWTVDAWEKFREGREQKSSISYKILMDIADFITDIMSGAF